jgi:hypothetical protein
VPRLWVKFQQGVLAQMSAAELEWLLRLPGGMARPAWHRRLSGHGAGHHGVQTWGIVESIGPAFAGCALPQQKGKYPMQTNTYEIADRIFRLSTCVPEAAPGGFTFNQFLVDADDPLLFHTGPRRMFPLVSQAIARIIPLKRLRWITFGHVESDECGATALSGATASTIRRLAAPEPQMLALMHGSSTRTRCGGSLLALADAYDSMSKQG